MSPARLLRRRVAEFTVSLRQALCDRSIEATRQTRFFYDADVVIGIVLGFRSVRESHYQPDEEQLLVRSLLATGFLGKIHMLRPHALELYKHMRSQPEYGRREAAGAFAREVKEFLKGRGLDGTARAISRLVRGREPEESKVARLLELMAEQGAESFVSIEMASGTWMHRLRRLQIGFDEDGPGMADLVGTEAARILNRAISKARGTTPSVLNNLRDSAALATLQWLVKASEDGEQPLVRFYSETPGLRRAWETDDEVRALLSEAGSAGLGEPRVVVRGAPYFILRATFEPLRFPGVEREQGARRESSVTLEQLELVAAELGRVIDASDAAIERALSDLQIGTRPLGLVIERLKDLYFVDRCWLAQPIPRGMTEILPALRDVDDFQSAHTARIYAELSRVIGSQEAKLLEIVDGVRSWFVGLRRVQERAEALRRRLRGEYEIEPMRDLGLVRWGLQLDPTQAEQIGDLVRGLTTDVEDEHLRACLQLAAAWERPPDEERACVLVAAGLWLLELYEDAERTITLFERSAKGLPPSLILMRSAARIRARNTSSVEEVREMLRELTEVGSALDRDSKGAFLLGLGYTAFHAWRDAKRRETHPEGALRELARTSLSAGEEACESLAGGTLAWSFAINHCAYVATVTAVDPAVAGGFIDRLIALRGDHAWHYRFADTVATYYMERARALLETGDVGERRRAACEWLRSAAGLLDEARPDFGDREVDEHRLQIGRLQLELECSKS